MTAVRRIGLPALLASAAVVVPAGAAAAVDPERTGWWNRLSAGGAALPQPQTQAGDLRVTAGPDGPTAFSALLYTAPDSAAATLDLTLREGSVVGTPEVVACPTLETEWPEGDNQPYDKAPEYDCDIGLSVGTVSEDGKTVSFALDSSTQVEEGVWSIALVPAPGSMAPFSIDVQKPGPESFTAEPPPFDMGDDGSFGESDSTSDSGSAESGDPFLTGGFEPPPSVETGSAEMPPLVAGGEAPPAPGAETAPNVAPDVASGVPQTVLTQQAGVVEDLGTGRRLLALLLLAGGSAAVGYAAGQQRPGPRLIGGRARLGAPAVAGGSVPTAPATEDRPRGIGRFAKPRDAAPRRLR